MVDAAAASADVCVAAARELADNLDARAAELPVDAATIAEWDKQAANLRYCARVVEDRPPFSGVAVGAAQEVAEAAGELACEYDDVARDDAHPAERRAEWSRQADGMRAAADHLASQRH